MAAAAIEPTAWLQELVRRHQVCWEVWPEETMVDGRRRQIGFELELSGTHPPEVNNASPGCDHCRNVFSALLDVAEYILPSRSDRPSEYIIGGYEPSVRYSPKRGFRPDVSLTIKIVHRQGFGPVDDCEQRCLKVMEDRLRTLGACPGVWQARKASSIFNLSTFLMAVMLLVVSNLGLAQSPQPASIRPEQEPFAEIDRRLNEAADAKLKDSFSLAQQADGVDGKNATNLSPVLSAAQMYSEHTFRQRTTAGPVARLDALRPVIEPELRDVGVPVELASIVLVESGAEIFALSPKGARGIWQLMPDTARRYGLRISAFNDERLDASKSTRAAARYLRDLYSQFGNWPLAFAAYNAGEQRVQRAVDQTGTTDFFRLSRFLPPETRGYVLAVLASFEEFTNPGRTFHAAEMQVFYALSRSSNGTRPDLSH